MDDRTMQVYNRLPIAFEKGEGAWLYDSSGKKYLDALCGIAVTGLGHAHPAVTKAIQEQASKVLHTSNIYEIPSQIELAKRLCEATGLAQAFFCNSGTEATEAALKLARLYGHQKGFDEPQILVMDGGFHGRTLGALSAISTQKIQKGFGPLLHGFVPVPFNDIRAIEAAAKGHNHIAAIFLEPIQGESGIHIPAPDYLQKLRAICDQKGWLLILDEVQCGMGRSGSLFAYQTQKILPDILTMAKGLANGVPIGACLATESIAKLFTRGSHGSTFGGNPLAMVAALATLKTIEQEKLWENAEKQGNALLSGLKEKLSSHPNVKEIRGKGLMIAIEMDKPCRDIMKVGLEKGLLFTVSAESIIRLLPPLIINDEQVNFILEHLPKCIEEHFGT